MRNKLVGCFIMDPPSGYAKPTRNQEGVDIVWSLDDTIRAIVLAHQAFPEAKVVLYSRYGMDQLQGALAKDAAGLAVSKFVVVKVGPVNLFWLSWLIPTFGRSLRTVFCLAR